MKQKIYQFEFFILDQKNRRVFFGDQLIDLTSKNFEILSLLVENSTRVVEKREIFEAVWSDNFVEENNLPVRISFLRGLFRKHGYAKEFIKTVSGRGYIFTVQTKEIHQNQPETYNFEVSKNSTASSEAKNLYFKGQYIIDTLPTRIRLREDLQQAEEFFNSAIRLDPNFAEAYAGSAYSKIFLYNFGFLSRDEARSKCKTLLQQGQSANPHSSDIYFLKGLVSFVYELNVPKAVKLLLKASQLNPGNPQIYYWLGTSQLIFNNPEKAYEYFLKAFELKPDNITFRAASIRVYYYSQNYNRAITAARDILEMEGRSYVALYFLSLSYARLGIFEEAARYCDELLKIIDIDETRLLKAYLLVLQNRHRAADRLLEEILSDEERLCGCLIYVIFIYAARHKPEAAFDLLFKYYERAHYDILIIKSEPGLKILHGDQRFQTILKKLSLDSDL